MNHHHHMKPIFAALFCVVLASGQAFGTTAAEDLDGQLEIRPSAPTASWPESGDSNELAPNYTATISVTVVESEHVGGVNYTLSSGPDATTGSSDPNVVWTESGTAFSITNTAADTASATMTLTCVWSPEGGDGGGDGPGPQDIYGQADADVQLLDSVVDWDFDRTRQWADGEKEIEFTVTVTDDNGFGLERWELTEFSATESDPSDPAWAFFPVASDGPAWITTRTALTHTPSEGKVKMTYDDGSEEERTSSEEIGFLMLEVEVQDDLTLLESWDLKVIALPVESDIDYIGDLQLEVQRVGKSQWYQFDHNGVPEYTEPARVAGKFIVRVKGSIEDSEHETEPTEEIEVRFPDADTILAGDGVRARMDQAWANTKSATTPTSRREEGYYITLNTSAGNEAYGVTSYTVGNQVANNAFAQLDGFGARPKDIPENPTPIHYSLYIVGWFHTHPPTKYQVANPGFPATQLVGPSGPPGGDHEFSSHASVNCPGFVYDYVPTGTYLGWPSVPFGHPIEATGEIKKITPPERRPAL